MTVALHASSRERGEEKNVVKTLDKRHGDDNVRA